MLRQLRFRQKNGFLMKKKRVVPVNKTKLDLTLILYNNICDH